MDSFASTQSVTGQGGLVLHVHRRPGPGTRLVLAHGITSEGGTWAPLLPALPEDWDILAPDARGHGQSARSTHYAYQQLAVDIMHVADAAAPAGQIALLGHSMGAATVALCAAQYPQRVSCVVLEDPPWRSTERAAEARHKRATAWRQQLEVQQRGSIAERMEVLASVRGHWSIDEVRACAEAEMRTDPRVLDLVAGQTPDWRDVLARIACPALLLCGDPERGAIVTAAVKDEARGLKPDLEVVDVTAAGHTIRADEPAQYARVVAAFLRRHAAGVG